MNFEGSKNFAKMRNCNATAKCSTSASEGLRRSSRGLVLLGELFVNCCFVYTGQTIERGKIEVLGDAGEKMFSILHMVDSKYRWGPTARLNNRLANFCLDSDNLLVCEMAIPLSQKEMVLEALRIRGFDSLEGFKQEKSAATETLEANIASENVKEVLSENVEAEYAKEKVSSNTETGCAKNEVFDEDEGMGKWRSLLDNRKKFDMFKKLNFNHTNLRQWFKIVRYKIPVTTVMHMVTSFRDKVKQAQQEKVDRLALQGRNILGDGTTDKEEGGSTRSETVIFQWRVPLAEILNPNNPPERTDQSIWLSAPAEGKTLYGEIEPVSLSLVKPWTWKRWWREFLASSSYSISTEMMERLIEDYKEQLLNFHATYNSALWELDIRHINLGTRLLRNKDPPLIPIEPEQVQSYPAMAQRLEQTLIERQKYTEIERATKGMAIGDIVIGDVISDVVLRAPED
eukprot:Gregarina_sp_Poly_1__9091@NODE_556_length_7542_cov_414_325351_g438_i0_p3_GENE_NODE_556_length_7542_cov_414_325351_g438_i0NODE_556_length_7542_cov_414_325351_g438_i0_p3_ORF_typecomplete_len457_score75_44_NODE_556_length_7542_cov_414_325351_g438_i0921462